MPKKLPPLDLAQLLPSWQLRLRSEHKAAATVKIYGDGVTAFLRWCQSSGVPASLDRDTVTAFTAALLEAGAEPATARSRQLSLKRFAAWLTAEGELDSDPLMGMKPPKLDTKVTDALTGDELKALIKACAGKGLRERRDEAIVRLMAETGVRAGEIVAMQTVRHRPDPRDSDGAARQGRQGPHRAVRAADRHRH